MPKVTKLYETSRKGLAHNMGGVFGDPSKKAKKKVEKTVKVKPEPVPSVEPKSAPKVVPKVDEALRKTKYAAYKRNMMKSPDTALDIVPYKNWKE